MDESLYSDDGNGSRKGVSVPLVECKKTPEPSVDAGRNSMDEVGSGGLSKREDGQCNPHVSKTYAERCMMSLKQTTHTNNLQGIEEKNGTRATHKI